MTAHLMPATQLLKPYLWDRLSIVYCLKWYRATNLSETIVLALMSCIHLYAEKSYATKQKCCRRGRVNAWAESCTRIREILWDLWFSKFQRIYYFISGSDAKYCDQHTEWPTRQMPTPLSVTSPNANQFLQFFHWRIR